MLKTSLILTCLPSPVQQGNSVSNSLCTVLFSVVNHLKNIDLPINCWLLYQSGPCLPSGNAAYEQGSGGQMVILPRFATLYPQVSTGTLDRGRLFPFFLFFLLPLETSQKAHWIPIATNHYQIILILSI